MKPTATILVGSPVSGEEARFLATLAADLGETEALVLANFMAGKRQIDFVVITATYAALLELKNFPRPVFGDRNGKWTYVNSAGGRVRYQGVNPWQQALDEKYALSDEMRAFQAKNPDISSPPAAGFFAEFDGFVCIHPRIHPDSRVTEGDHKVRVRSYPDVVDRLRTGAKVSTWSLADWRRFAEEHLHLEVVTLEQATDSRIAEATERLEAYRARLSELVGAQLPPLIPSSENANYGEGLVTTLLNPSNYLLLGPTGSAKTFHLHHLAVSLANGGDEVPLLVEGKRYRGGDFWNLVRQGTAPLFRGDPKDLLDAIRLSGLKPVLMVDALNECPRTHLADLVRGVQTFALQFEARLVVSSQLTVEIPAELRAITIRLPLPDGPQKRLIYGHHAGLAATPDLDTFCAGFTNAYDLAVAGRCHIRGPIVESRADLYDRYVRGCVPDHTAVVLAVLRTVAGKMADAFSLVWRRDLFETTAERILSEQQASLEILDELRRCRLVDLTDDYFSFEHELLFDYFRAEELRRREGDVSSLAAELKRPRNRDLLELVLPRFSASDELGALLAVAEDTSILGAVLSGRCGKAAQKVLIAECDRLFAAAMADLPSLEVACETVAADGGRTQFAGLRVASKHRWTPFDVLLCRAIGHNLDHPSIRAGFLELLDMTEWTLRMAVHKAARAARFAPGPVWGEAVRLYGGLIQYGVMTLPCVEMLAGIRTSLVEKEYGSRRLAIREQLLERTRKDPASHFALLTLLEHHQYGSNAADIAIALELAERALASGIYILRVNAFDDLQSFRGVIEKVCPDEVGRVRSMLEAAETDNIMENTARLEALVAYGGLAEPIVSFTDAQAQFRAVISTTPESDAALAELARSSGTTPQLLRAEFAYNTVTRMFEDVFENVYWDAYAELSDTDKGEVLRAAGMAPEIGFWSDWIVRELFRYGGERALAVYQRFAAGIDSGTVLVQDSVSAFVLAIHGCAQWMEEPPSYEKGDSPEHRAWRLVGECLFWTAKGDKRRASQLIQALGEDLENPVVLAMGDVLYQVSHSGWRIRNSQPSFDLIALFREEWQPILQQCVIHRESLTSIFRYGGRTDRNVIAFLIQTLGRIGDDTTVPTLRELVDDDQLGTNAIHALEALERSLRLGRRATP